MPASLSHVGPGDLLRIYDGTGANPTAIAEIQDIDGIDVKSNMHLVGHQDSPGGVQEQKPGMIVNQPIKGTANFIDLDTTQITTGLYYLQMNRIPRIFDITDIDGTTVIWSATCYVDEFHTKFPQDGPQTLDFSLTPTGPATLT